MHDHGSDVINRLTVDWLREQLTEEEWEILTLWNLEGLTFDEIGVIIGQKYRPDDVEKLTGSGVRYHYGRILEKCRSLAGALE